MLALATSVPSLLSTIGLVPRTLAILSMIALCQVRLRSRNRCHTRVALVGHLATCSTNDFTTLLLLNVVQLFLTSLVNCDDVFLQDSQLLLEIVELVIEIILGLLVLIELLI